MPLRRFDDDLVAIAQMRIDRNVTAVDVGRDRFVADVRMHRIGEIERRRPAWQRDEPTLRREAKDLVVEEFELRVFEKFFRVRRFEQ